MLTTVKYPYRRKRSKIRRIERVDLHAWDGYRTKTSQVSASIGAVGKHSRFNPLHPEYRDPAVFRNIRH